jgi:hypothetical protein
MTSMAAANSLPHVKFTVASQATIADRIVFQKVGLNILVSTSELLQLLSQSILE